MLNLPANHVQIDYDSVSVIGDYCGHSYLLQLITNLHVSIAQYTYNIQFLKHQLLVVGLVKETMGGSGM